MRRVYLNILCLVLSLSICEVKALVIITVSGLVKEVKYDGVFSFIYLVHIRQNGFIFFEQLFGSGFRQRQAPKGKDLQATLSITLQEAATEHRQTFTINNEKIINFNCFFFRVVVASIFVPISCPFVVGCEPVFAEDYSVVLCPLVAVLSAFTLSTRDNRSRRSNSAE